MLLYWPYPWQPDATPFTFPIHRTILFHLINHHSLRNHTPGRFDKALSHYPHFIFIHSPIVVLPRVFPHSTTLSSCPIFNILTSPVIRRSSRCPSILSITILTLYLIYMCMWYRGWCVCVCWFIVIPIYVFMYLSFLDYDTEEGINAEVSYQKQNYN